MKNLGRVALIGENSIEYVNALLDIWNNGDCAVLLDWKIPFQTIMEMMKEADVHKCYIDKKQFNKFDTSVHLGIEFIIFERKSCSAEFLPDFIYNKFKVNYSHTESIVLYSSGTTGKEKGIILSHFAINTNADAIIDYMQPNAVNCIYIAKTFSHSSTLTGELLVALKTRMKLVIAPTIVPPRYIYNNIRKFGVSIICVNPTLLSILSDEVQRTNYDISPLKTIYVSGSILNNVIYEKAHKAFINISIYNVYGLSEAGPRVTAQRIGCCKSNSVGRPIKYVEIEIVNDKGNPVPKGERGIVHVNTPSIYDNYITGNNKHNSLYKNWHNTGDVGYYDENQELHIVDRIDDVIEINSHKIYPSYVEHQICSILPVIDCMIFLMPFSKTKEICCLYVADVELENQNIRKLAMVLLSYEIPRFFVRCQKIPTNNNGKRSTGLARMLIRNTSNYDSLYQ